MRTMLLFAFTFIALVAPAARAGQQAPGAAGAPALLEGAPPPYVDRELGIRIQAPPGYAPMRDSPKTDDVLGEVRAAFQGAQAATTGEVMVVHRMPIPFEGGFDLFRGRLAVYLAGIFDERFLLDQQVHLEAAGKRGFMIDFECSGDGIRPEPGGEVRHHVRWLFLPGADGRLTGVMFSARQSAWPRIAAGIDASIRTLAKPE